MEFTACPKCGSFSPASAKECQDCHAPLPEQPVAPPAIPAAPAASVPPPVAEVPAPSATPAFDAAPEVLAKVQQLEAAIAQKPSATALYLQLAQVYVDAKRKDLAVQAVERCLVREPGNTYLRHRLAQLTGKPDSVPVAPVAAKASAPAPTAPRPPSRPSNGPSHRRRATCWARFPGTRIRSQPAGPGTWPRAAAICRGRSRRGSTTRIGKPRAPPSVSPTQPTSSSRASRAASPSP